MMVFRGCLHTLVVRLDSPWMLWAVCSLLVRSVMPISTYEHNYAPSPRLQILSTMVSAPHFGNVVPARLLHLSIIFPVVRRIFDSVVYPVVGYACDSVLGPGIPGPGFSGTPGASTASCNSGYGIVGRHSSQYAAATATLLSGPTAVAALASLTTGGPASLVVVDPGNAAVWNIGGGGAAIRALTNPVNLQCATNPRLSGIVDDGAGGFFFSDSACAEVLHLIGGGGWAPVVIAPPFALATPMGLARNGSGILVADCAANVLWSLDPVSGSLVAVLGQPGIAGFNSDSVVATSATLLCPAAVAFDAVGGSTLVADAVAHVVIRITSAGVAYRVAGAA